MQTVKNKEIDYDSAELLRLRPLLYSFLGNSLLRPLPKEVSAEVLNPRFWDDFPLRPVNQQMHKALSSLISCTQQLQEVPLEDAQSAVSVEYTRLFIGPGAPLAPPWESLYRDGAVTLCGQPTLEMRKLFSQKGLRVDNPNRQFEDHLGLELLFLASRAENLLAESTINEQTAELQESYRTHALIEQQEVAEQLGFIRNHPLWWIEA